MTPEWYLPGMAREWAPAEVCVGGKPWEDQEVEDRKGELSQTSSGEVGLCEAV